MADGDRNPALPSLPSTSGDAASSAACSSTLSIERIIAARPQSDDQDNFKLVYILLRELPAVAANGDQNIPRYQFIWSDDANTSQSIWNDSVQLQTYLGNFNYAGLSRKPSNILEVTLIPENGHMPMGTVLSQYVFVTVERLHLMIFSTAPFIELIPDTDSSETTTSGQESVTSFLSPNEEEDGDDEDESDYDDSDNNERTIFRFPDLPNRGLHEFNLFLPPTYALGQLIGQGEFANIKLAVNIETENLYAVKIFRPRRSTMVTEQVIREVETLKGIDCPNILKVAEIILYGDNTFMVMELMRKGDMRVYINRNGPLLEILSRKFFIDLLNGVNYIHRRNIVHLDLKLENLLLDDHLNLKIADFGCAKVQMGQKLFSHPCGSYAYGAPEVISGREFDGKKADTWSMGVILYCMVVARLPFDDKQQDVKEMLKERKCVSNIERPVSAHCKELIGHMLAYKKDRRAGIQEIMCNQWLHVNV